MYHLRVLICFVALAFATNVAAAGDFNEAPPRNLTQLKQVHLWATYYHARHGRRADAPYGLGAFGHRLVPFRSIAADQRVFESGTVFFIPGLVGTATDGSGASGIHDGYVFVADIGPAVRGPHIDIFIGTMRKNPAPDLITASRRQGFDAYIVTDQALIERLRRLHERP